MSCYLITGISGTLARLTAKRLLSEGHEVVGVDYRHKPGDFDLDIPYYRANYNKTKIEDVFRHHPPDGVLHLGRVGNLKVQINKRFDLNVIGSAKIRDLCLKYDVRRLVVLSTFHIYGAHAENHIPIFEDEPLRSGTTFPELADAVQLDSQAAQWVYQHPSLRCVVLRPCNVVGPNVQNAMSRYLRQPRLAYILGYSPMSQFIHEDDMVDALHLALFGDAVGVFNVAGAGELPLVHALELTGAKLYPVPGPLAQLILAVQGRLGPAFPPYLLDFFKYPCIISDSAFRERFGYVPRVGLVETIRSTAERRG